MEPRGVYRIPLFVTFYNFSVLCCVLLFYLWRFTHFNIFQCLFILYFFANKKTLRTVVYKGIFYIIIRTVPTITSTLMTEIVVQIIHPGILSLLALITRFIPINNTIIKTIIIIRYKAPAIIA